MTGRDSLMEARELLALAEAARSVQKTWWLWDEPAPEPDGYGPLLAFARAATPEQIAALCNLVRGLASACDAVVGDIYLRDRGEMRLTLFESSIRETMERLYAQFPEARRA